MKAAKEANAVRFIYYYPLETEQRLINAVKSGEKDDTVKIIDHIYGENFSENKVSDDMKGNLLSEMAGTIYKLCEPLHLRGYDSTERISRSLAVIKGGEGGLHMKPGLKERFEEAREVLLFLCDSACNRGKEVRRGLKEEIREFLNDNYADQSISLSLMATKFNYTESNFSHYFKERFGQNFSSYLEEMRISAACALINESPYPLDEIAEKVGYNSATSFRRAFKRVMGVLPSRYKRG